MMLTTRNPQKNYGKAAWDIIASTILATDYKSPPLLLIYENEPSLDDRECALSPARK